MTFFVVLQPKSNLVYYSHKVWLLVTIFFTKLMTGNGDRKVQTTVLESATGTVTFLQVSQKWKNVDSFLGKKFGTTFLRVPPQFKHS